MPKLGSGGIVPILVIIVVLTVAAGGMLFQQYNLTQHPISCGGDWNYNVKCPLGSYCNAQDPLVGGWCTPYLSPLFGNSQLQPIPMESNQPSADTKTKDAAATPTPEEILKSTIQADVKQIQVALELYHEYNAGRYPQNLDMLVPRFLQSVPKNPYTLELYPYSSSDTQYSLKVFYPDGTVVTKTPLYK